MQILVLGGNGMLGHQVFRTLGTDHDCHVTFRHPRRALSDHWVFRDCPADRLIDQVDALNLTTVAEAMARVRPDVVVNCIGIVKQRDESADAITSIRINGLFPHLLAEMCNEYEARLIQFSTDCVFSGRQGQYRESDYPDPADLYGRSKLLGEVSGSMCLTVRTSIVGWELGTRQGLLEWFASQRGRQIRGFRQAIFSGLSTATAGRLVKELIEKLPDLNGIYHVAGQAISKYELLTRLRERLGWYDITVDADDDFRCDRSLNGEKFHAATGWKAPDWDQMIQDLANEWPLYAAWR